MNIIKTFRIVIGVLLLISTTTIFFLLFLEIDSLAVLFNFSIDTSADNLSDALLGLIGGIVAGFMFFFGMIFVGIINAILYTTFGVLTLSLKRTIAMPIIVSILSAFALFLEARALMILTIGGLTSRVLPIRVVSDIIIIALSIVSLILIFKEEKAARV